MEARRKQQALNAGHYSHAALKAIEWADKDHEGFRKLVKEMRTAQRKYFRTRSGEALINSKRLEGKVDRLLSDNNIQLSLF